MSYRNGYAIVLACMLCLVLQAEVAAQYQPGGLPGTIISAWYDAGSSAILHPASGGVHTLADKSAYGLPLQQIVSSYAPAYAAISHEMTFDGATNNLHAESAAPLAQFPSGGNPSSVLVVGSSSAATGTVRTAFSAGPDGTPFGAVRSVGIDSTGAVLVGTLAQQHVTSTPWPAARAIVFAAFRATALGVALNGDPLATMNAAVSTAAEVRRVYAGSQTDSTAWWGGSIAEIVSLSAWANETQRRILENYASTRWQVPLRGGDHYAEVADHHRSLLGIGRESATDWVSATGSSEGLGFAGTTGFPGFLREDGDYLLAARHDTLASVDRGAGDLPANAHMVARWNAVWYVDKTDVGANGGEVSLVFDFRAYYGPSHPIIAPDTARHALVFRTSPAGTFTVVPSRSRTTDPARPGVLIITLDASQLADGYFTLGIGNGITPVALPVELTSFTGRCIDGRVHLHWRTASESCNAGFDIQRRGVSSATLGEDRSWQWRDSGWTSCGFVAGGGTTSSAHEYAFIDEMPDVPAADRTLYYRLRQIDFNGRARHSGIIAIARGARPDGVTLDSPYPNPFSTHATVMFVLDTPAVVSLVLTTADGRAVRVLCERCTYDAGAHLVRIPRGDLLSGVYFLSLETDAMKIVRPLTFVR